MSAESEPDDMPECDCCRYQSPTLKLTPTRLESIRRLHHEEMLFCEFCRGTIASTWLDYQRGGEGIEIIKAICYVGNAIIDAIGRQRV